MIGTGLINGLLSVLSWETAPILIIGAFIGWVIGVIPGLSGHFAIAMLIPFAYRMDPVVGVTLLLSAHAAVSQGGGITAILFAVPGTGMSAATLLDGPLMTEKGEGGRAVGAGMMACVLGAFFGAFILALLLPVLRHVVLLFGPADFFMLALLSLTFIAVLGGGGEINKGLIGGTLGLLTASVGVGVITGETRFTFGLMVLSEGFPMVPVMLGVFGVAEMVDLWIKGGSLARKGSSLSALAMQKQIFLGIRDTYRNWWLVLRCSAIGMVVGLIPGLGSGAASFVAYAHAKQTSKNPENFGRGAVEGVIAPEAAGDAVEGGALATTLAFGIPGSSSMAILITGLIIMGIEPGPMFISQNQNLVFTMIWTIVLGNIAGTVLGMVMANPLARMTFLRGSVLVPVLLAILFTGCFVIDGSRFDMTVGLIFGLLGFVMKKLNYSRPAFIIGFILERMIERNLFLATKISGPTFFLQPMALGLLVITISVLAYNIYTLLKGRKKDDDRAGFYTGEKSDYKADLTFCLFIMIVLVVFFVAGLSYQPATWRAALVIIILLFFMLVWQLLVIMKQFIKARTDANELHPHEGIYIDKWKKATVLFSWLALFIAMIYVAGHTFGIALFLIIFLRFVSRERWVMSLLLGLGIAVGIKVLFEEVMNIQLYPGAIYEYVTALMWV